MRWEGVDEKLARMVSEANLDQAAERRRVRDAFKDVQLGIDHCLFKAQYTGIIMEESYEVNSRGLQIFSKCWLPENNKIKALICFCHGYGDTCTFFFEGIAKKIASCGYGVFAMDYPGFGLSEGLHGYISSFDTLVKDVSEHFSKIKENPEYQGLPSFLFGQSMGGAVALKVHFEQPNCWNGAILVAPMCKMADAVVPPWPVLLLLICMALFFPRQKWVPQKDLADLAFKEKRKRDQCSYNVIAYKDKPRLRTALELLKTTKELERRLEEVCLPLLILHGEADIVTDPSVSIALYEKARSSDKKLHIYSNAYHSILEAYEGESSSRKSTSKGGDEDVTTTHDSGEVLANQELQSDEDPQQVMTVLMSDLTLEEDNVIMIIDQRVVTTKGKESKTTMKEGNELFRDDRDSGRGFSLKS